jgi:plasmid stabilization system protein ParE
VKLVVTPDAAADLERQIDYLVEHGSFMAARRLADRVTVFLEQTLTRHPRVGKTVGHRGVYETWIPQTRLIVWYRLTGETIEIVRFWHSAQDRNET